MNNGLPRIPDFQDRARKVMARHKLPEFIKSFDVRLGLSDGRPAVIVVYKTEDDHGLDMEVLLRQVSEFGKLDNEVLPELSDEFEELTPISVMVSGSDEFSY